MILSKFCPVSALFEFYELFRRVRINQPFPVEAGQMRFFSQSMTHLKKTAFPARIYYFRCADYTAKKTVCTFICYKEHLCGI